MLTVYHGSTCRVEQPLAGVCRPNLDFGIGFYITDIKEQAIRWALRNADLRHETEAWLNIYSFDKEACLHSAYQYLHFEAYNAEWLDFVVDCRKGGVAWQAYDVIEGGIADDRVIRTIDLYMRGDYNRDEALARLKHQEANNQICIVNQKIIDTYLHFTKASLIPKPEQVIYNTADIAMQSKYYDIIEQLAARLHITSNKALDLFYNSDTYQLLMRRTGDLYLMSSLYIVDEIIRELQSKQG